jgi:hypothetical protein
MAVSISSILLVISYISDPCQSLRLDSSVAVGGEYGTFTKDVSNLLFTSLVPNLTGLDIVPLDDEDLEEDWRVQMEQKRGGAVVDSAIELFGLRRGCQKMIPVKL